MTEKEAQERLEKSPLRIFEESLQTKKDHNAKLGALAEDPNKKGNEDGKR